MRLKHPGEAPAAHHSYFSSSHPLASLGRGWGETASALKDVSHALGGLMGREHVLERGWVSSGKRSFFAGVTDVRQAKSVVSRLGINTRAQKAAGRS